MSFTSDIPTTGQTLGNSRTQVLGNFTNYKELISEDHVAPNDPGQGKHKWCHFPVAGTPPTASSQEMVLFSKNNTGATLPYFRKDSSTTTYPIIPIKAFAVVDGLTGAALGTSYNVTPARIGTGAYTITLPANTVASVNVGVFVSVTNGGPNIITYTNMNYAAQVLTFEVDVWAASTTATHVDRTFSVMVVEFV